MALGLFGAVARTISARRFEIGVRRALGAPDWRVAGLVLSDTAVLIGWGFLVGIAGALAVSQPLRLLLYDVRLADPRVLVVAPAVLLASCALAVVAPTWRALRINAAVARRDT